jgi:hypothetical protein
MELDKSDSNGIINETTLRPDFFKEAPLSAPENSHSVRVVIINTVTEYQERIKRLKQHFDPDFFDVQVHSIVKEEPIKNVRDEEKIVGEFIYMYLSEANHNSNLKCPILFIKDTSVAAPEVEQNVIRTMMIKTLKSNFDLLYLCKWQDDCGKHKKVEGAPDYIRQTMRAMGLQALMITPQGAAKILNQVPLQSPLDIEKGLENELRRLMSRADLIAMTTTPNMFNFDSSLTGNSRDYYRNSECSVTDEETSETSSSNSTWSSAGWIIFIAIAIVVLLIAFALIVLGPGSKKKSTV